MKYLKSWTCYGDEHSTDLQRKELNTSLPPMTTRIPNRK